MNLQTAKNIGKDLLKRKNEGEELREDEIAFALVYNKLIETRLELKEAKESDYRFRSMF